MKLRALLFVSLIFFLAADDAKDAEKKELAKLDGTWTTDSLKYNGKDVDKYKGKLKFVLKDGKCTIEGIKAVKQEYATIVFKVDPSTNPRCLDMTVTGGSQKDAAIEGIYELKDDEFKICAKLVGKDRPLKFESPEGSSMVLLILKREK